MSRRQKNTLSTVLAVILAVLVLFVVGMAVYLDHYGEDPVIPPDTSGSSVSSGTSEIGGVTDFGTSDTSSVLSSITDSSTDGTSSATDTGFVTDTGVFGSTSASTSTDTAVSTSTRTTDKTTNTSSHVTDTSTKKTDTSTHVTDTSTGTSTKTSTKTSTTLPPITTNIPPNTGAKRVAFTFDDGPYSPVTNGIVDAFKEVGGNCTFFVVGDRVYGEWAESVKYAYENGNEIAVHGYTHEYYYDTCSESRYFSEMSKTAEKIIETVGKEPVLMRPIGGRITKARVASCPYSVIQWNLDTNDWRYKKESQANIDIIVNKVLKYVEDGDIILMHDLYKNTLAAVEILLPKLKEMGYEFVTVSELLGEYRYPGMTYSGG